MEMVISDLPPRFPQRQRRFRLPHPPFAVGMLGLTLLVVIGLEVVALNQLASPFVRPGVKDCSFPGTISLHQISNRPYILVVESNQLQAINRDTGISRWSLSSPTTLRSNTGPRPQATPSIVAFSDDRCLYVISAYDGHLLWGHTYATGAAPWNWALAGNTIYLQGHTRDRSGNAISYVAALDATSGTYRWITPLQTDLPDMLSVAQGSVFANEYVPNATPSTIAASIVPLLYALDVSTGKQQWVAEGDGSFVAATNSVVITSGGGLAGRDRQTGAFLWTVPDIFGQGLRPALVGDIVEAPGQGYVTAVNWHTGAVVWRNQFPIRSAFNASYPIDDQTIVAKQNEVVRGIDVATGTTLWETRASGTSDISWGDGLVLTGVSLLGESPEIEAHDARSFATLWHIDQVARADEFPGTPQTLFFTHATTLINIDSTTGRQRWQTPLDAPDFNLQILEG